MLAKPSSFVTSWEFSPIVRVEYMRVLQAKAQLWKIGKIDVNHRETGIKYNCFTNGTV